ncbi:aromatic-ring-hydroxylating dioxygenase subunit beta [Breoghania sp.]|uniref:aromatic-ring-hydroxylating dioxygenase subunit beta n=1 Tax=Breoghania sp. TaxID=2065378 RepID=UPI00260EC5C5|nr:aromatic-ring-hydroxylating dioxygenase subunit beta [Breoghania sp.]MDJ0933109.1 aromatic-ring-hydroxylating dioxygenase subunit beta [Breoghania sp.]
MKQGGGFPVKVLGEQQFSFPGNWKIQLENTTDAYHFSVVHKPFLQSLDAEIEDLFSFLDGDGFVEDLGNGHSVMVMMPSLIKLDEDNGWKIHERFSALGRACAENTARSRYAASSRRWGARASNLNLFPNAACSLSFFRILRPVSVEETHIRHIAIGMDGGPEEANQMRFRLHEHFQGPMGFGSPDDAEVWERVQRGTAGGPELDILVNRDKGLEKDGSNGLPRGNRYARCLRHVEEGDEQMSAVMTAEKTISLQEAQEFIWLEADILDRADYDVWLKLWIEDGHYVIPVERDDDDFRNHLNILYDDASMRKMRTERLQGGFAISAVPAARTIRLSSRFAVIESLPGALKVRSAMHLTEDKFGRQRPFLADVEHHLVRRDGKLLIHDKIVRLINSEGVLTSISYLS